MTGPSPKNEKMYGIQPADSANMSHVNLVVHDTGASARRPGNEAEKNAK